MLAPPTADTYIRSVVSRRTQRALLTIGIGIVGCVLVLWDDDPFIRYLGIGLIVVSILGLGGVNIHRGGPYDLRFDPPDTPMSEHRIEERIKAARAEKTLVERIRLGTDLLWIVAVAGILLWFLLFD